jgi:hypothetical protein
VAKYIHCVSEMDQFRQVINGIPTSENFRSGHFNSPYPRCTVIHRCAPGVDKQHLVVARSGSEFTRRVYNENIFVSMRHNRENHRQGMSCSASCYYGPHVRSGNIPLAYLPADRYTVNEAAGSVFIGDVEYGLVKCYHRSVYTADRVTVGQRLDNMEEFDICMLDDNFALYFENADRGLIILRREVQQDATNFTFSQSNRQAIFNHPFFDLDSWVECDTLFVKAPIPVISLVLSGKSIEAEMAVFSDVHCRTIHGLLSAFNIADFDKLEEINIALEHLFISQRLNAIDLGRRSKIVDILDEYATDIWGDEDGYYMEELRPALLKETSEDTNKYS